MPTFEDNTGEAQIYLSNDKIKEFILFQFERKFIEVTKSHLKDLEEIKNNSPKSLDFPKYRKHALDKMNDSLREIQNLFDKVQIALK